MGTRVRSRPQMPTSSCSSPALRRPAGGFWSVGSPRARAGERAACWRPLAGVTRPVPGSTRLGNWRHGRPLGERCELDLIGATTERALAPRWSSRDMQIASRCPAAGRTIPGRAGLRVVAEQPVGERRLRLQCALPSLAPRPQRSGRCWQRCPRGPALRTSRRRKRSNEQAAGVEVYTPVHDTS